MGIIGVVYNVFLLVNVINASIIVETRLYQLIATKMKCVLMTLIVHLSTVSSFVLALIYKEIVKCLLEESACPLIIVL